MIHREPLLSQIEPSSADIARTLPEAVGEGEVSVAVGTVPALQRPYTSAKTDVLTNA